MGNKNEFSFLNNIDIFSELNEKELNVISDLLEKKEVKTNEVVFYEGEIGNNLFIVKSGKISSYIKLPDKSQKMIAEFFSGNFFGEMSIIENAPRSATCLGVEDSVIYKLNKKDFFTLFDTYPSTAIKIMYKMLNIITGRLRNTGKFLMDMVRWGDEASRRAITDELTGIYNRRFLDRSLKEFFIKAERYKNPLSLIMVDLDYFREINEGYSHKIGDDYIIAVVEIYKKHLRSNDIFARYGGDEFTIILPDTESKEALSIAEDIRKEVEGLIILKDIPGPDINISVSQGIAVYPENSDCLEGLIKKADQALYNAKENGRNRVVFN